MKKTVSLALIVLTLMLSFVSLKDIISADETLKATNVKVEITVNENNTYDITETIDIEFATPHHGIIRSIPLYNIIRRADGTSSSNDAEISNVTCSDNYSTSYESGHYIIKIGDPDITLEGHKQYVISYSYDIGNDTWKNGDEFYFNIIGTEWTYAIEHLEAVIHFPKEFDPGKFGVSHGAEGSSDYSGVLQKIVENTVYLDYSETLQPGEAFTVRCTFEEGYFKKRFSLYAILISVFSTLFALAATVLNRNNYSKHGKPEPVIQTVEFYPPENMSPPRMIHTLRNTTSTQSVTGLLLLLARNGFLTIQDLGDKDYRLVIYDKPTDELSHEEKLYLEGLIKNGKPQEDGTVLVTRDDLKYSFYSTVSDIISYINNKTERIYAKGQGMYAALSIISGLILVIVVPLAIAITNTFRRFNWYHYAAMGISVVTGIYQFVLGCMYRRRTERNNRLCGMIMGFRDFLEVAEKDRLEMLVEENPMYFYDVLPYAYAFGISDKWIRKFEDIGVPPASWYEGNDVVYFMGNTMDSYAADSISTDSSDSSDSSSGWSSSSDSGGGFSGGGSGGGGSSGW